MPTDIYSIPLETLSTIFVLSLASDKQIIAHSSKLSKSPPLWMNPLPLCAVSSSWRSIALHTPRLWQRVFVCVPARISGAMTELKAQELVLWIERSGSLPLTLFIRDPCMMPHLGKLGARDPIVQVLNCYASRWETLYFKDTYQGRGYRPDWDLLELIRLEEWNSLRRIHGVQPCDTIKLWAQLTHLQVTHYVSCPEALDIFKGCPRLVWLSLSIHVLPDHASGHFDVTVSPIVLHDLSFVSFTSDNLSAIIQLISLPSLRELSVSKISPPTTDLGSLKSLLSFLTRSCCTLDKLNLQLALPPFPDDLVQILAHRSCNFLTSLTIRDYHLDEVLFNNEILQRLTLHHDEAVCTHLKYLTLHCEVLALWQAKLLEMVESRIGPRADQLPEEQLQILDLRISDFDHGHKLNEIAERSGMEYQEGTHSDASRSYRLLRRGFRTQVPTAHDVFEISMD